jgi:para-nitrobenzyl esterase
VRHNPVCAFATCAVNVSSVAAQVRTLIPPLRIDSGLVASQGVRAWLGIPYVQAPVGDRRWRAPQPTWQPTSWDGVYNSNRKMPACIQILRPHEINRRGTGNPTTGGSRRP